jgi:hypothetical protein
MKFYTLKDGLIDINVKDIIYIDLYTESCLEGYLRWTSKNGLTQNAYTDWINEEKVL